MRYFAGNAIGICASLGTRIHFETLLGLVRNYHLLEMKDKRCNTFVFLFVAQGAAETPSFLLDGSKRNRHDAA